VTKRKKSNFPFSLRHLGPVYVDPAALQFDRDELVLSSDNEQKKREPNASLAVCVLMLPLKMIQVMIPFRGRTSAKISKSLRYDQRLLHRCLRGCAASDAGTYP
jgi:hypothetical protein